MYVEWAIYVFFHHRHTWTYKLNNPGDDPLQQSRWRREILPNSNLPEHDSDSFPKHVAPISWVISYNMNEEKGKPLQRRQVKLRVDNGYTVEVKITT